MKKTTQDRLLAWLASSHRPQLQVYQSSGGALVACQAGNPTLEARGKTLEEAVSSLLEKAEKQRV